MKKLNTQGFAHHLLLVALVVAGVSAIGYVVVSKSSADSFSGDAAGSKLVINASDWSSRTSAEVQATTASTVQLLDITNDGSASKPIDDFLLANAGKSGTMCATAKLSQLDNYEPTDSIFLQTNAFLKSPEDGVTLGLSDQFKTVCKSVVIAGKQQLQRAGQLKLSIAPNEVNEQATLYVANVTLYVK